MHTHLQLEKFFVQSSSNTLFFTLYITTNVCTSTMSFILLDLTLKWYIQNFNTSTEKGITHNLL